MNPSDVMELHRAIGEDLECAVDDQERKNESLKQRIYELKDSLNPRPLLAKALAIAH